MSKLTVILPAYNEEENIETMVGRWRQFRAVLVNKHGLELKIVAVNDGSKDRTM